MPDLVDPFKRKIDYLRLSITDRCNLRCIYCMPLKVYNPGGSPTRGGMTWKSHDEILTYEEIALFARYAVQAGISKIRLTGGEPLIRRDVVGLVGDLCAIPDVKDISLTTNGLLLADYVDDLVKAGLRRVNISIDSLKPDVYRRITRGGDLERVLDGLEAVLKAPLHPVKVNVVVLRGINDDLGDFIELAYNRPVHVRFIEYMPFNEEIGQDYFVSCSEMRRRIEGLGEFEEILSPPGAGPARYLKLKGALGTLGFISPMSGHFCSRCNRLRLTAEGKLRTCLFSDEEVDVREVLRRGAGEEEVVKLIGETLAKKPRDRFSARRDFQRRMFQIGG